MVKNVMALSSAADPTLTYLMGLALVLVFGILITILANKLRISNILLLILFGLALGAIPQDKYPLFSFDDAFLISLAVLTLVMIVFDGSSRFKLGEIDEHSWRGLKIVLVFMGLNILILTPATLFAYSKDGVGWFAASLYALMFSVIMVGTDPGSVFILLKNTTHRVIDVLKIEAIMNTPLMVLIPFLLMDILNQVTSEAREGSLFDILTGYIPGFISQIVVGLGVGLLTGLIIIKLMRKFYSETLSPVALMGAALLTYALAEWLGGNGVLAVAFLGVAFGNTYVREKTSLQEFSSHLSLSLEILVYVLIGIAIFPTLPWTNTLFWMRAALLFLVLFVSRLATILLLFRKEDTFGPKEKLFMALNMPKGIAVAVVVFKFLSSNQPDYFIELLNLTVVFMMISLLIASVTDRFGNYFLIPNPADSTNTATTKSTSPQTPLAGQQPHNDES